MAERGRRRDENAVVVMVRMFQGDLSGRLGRLCEETCDPWLDARRVVWRRAFRRDARGLDRLRE